MDEIAAAEAHELLILQALDSTYQCGKMEYMHYGPARDATAARLAALGWHREFLKEQGTSS